MDIEKIKKRKEGKKEGRVERWKGGRRKKKKEEERESLKK